jgi:hypothetical protein
MIAMVRLTCQAFTVPRRRGSNWPNESNMNALMLAEADYMGLQVSYAAPAQLSGHLVLGVAHKFWNGSENTPGAYANLGFLFLYELLTGTKKVKLIDPDCSRSFAVLLAQLLSDIGEAAFLPSILSMMCRYPHLIELMPKFKDNRKFKNTTISASDPSDDGDGVGPLASLVAGCLSVLQAEIYNIMLMNNVSDAIGKTFVPPNDEPVNISVDALSVLEAERKWIVPQISNYSNSLGTLRALRDGGVSPSLELSEGDVESFTTQPLKSIQLHEYIRFVSPAELQRSVISDALPFDVSKHRISNTAVAHSMLKRLETDTAEYAHAMNHDLKPRLSLLDDMQASFSSDVVSDESKRSAKWNNAVESLNKLICDLERLRASDTAYVGLALPWLSGEINLVAIPVSTSAEDSAATVEVLKRRLFLLRRLSGQETHIWLEFLFGTTLSSRQQHDLSALNPFLEPSKIELLNGVISAAVLHANRIGQINRCLLDARGIQKSMKRLEGLRSSSAARIGAFDDLAAVASSTLQEIILKSESLVNNLNIGRHYIRREDMLSPTLGTSESVEAVLKRPRTSESKDLFVYDPRFLMFEFTWNILLRKVQVDMVREYVSDLRQGKSSVKQMIMGAGNSNFFL